jgi:Collagen triple helix repeat (20 copies)
MKSNLIVLFAVLSLSSIGCNSTPPPAAPALSTIAGAASSSGCSVAQVTGGAQITCSDGSSALISSGTAGSNGSSGATGAQGAVGATGPQGPMGPQGVAGANGSQGAMGPTGAQGLAGMFQAVDMNGVTIGNEFVETIPYSAASGSVVATLVHYDVGNVFIYYSSQAPGTGSIVGVGGVEYIYYQMANCAGQAYAEIMTNGSSDGLLLPMGNLHFRQYTSNNGVSVQAYHTNANSVVGQFQYQSKSIYGPTLDCINTGALQDTELMAVTPESNYGGNAAVLNTIAVPISLVIQ